MQVDELNSLTDNYGRIVKKAIYYAYYNLCKEFSIDSTQEITLDFYIVNKIIDRCKLDFQRLIIRHKKITNIDCHKIAGYLTFWLCKLRPVSIMKKSLYDDKKYHYMNEILAISASLLVINGEKDKRLTEAPSLNNNHIELTMLKPIYMYFIYTLRYCNTNQDLLSMIYHYVDNVA